MNNIILPGVTQPILPESERFRRALVMREFCGSIPTDKIEEVNQMAREKFGACGLQYVLAELVAVSAERDRLSDKLRLFVGAATPCSTEIDARGHTWSEAYLDDALKEAQS